MLWADIKMSLLYVAFICTQVQKKIPDSWKKYKTATSFCPVRFHNPDGACSSALMLEQKEEQKRSIMPNIKPSTQVNNL